MSRANIIVYNLVQDPILHTVVPQAHIATCDRAGNPRVIISNALPSTVESFKPMNFGPDHEKLIDLCTELTEEHIISSFGKKNRRLSTIKKILDDESSNYSLKLLLNQKMSRFISLAIENKIELYWNVARNSTLKNHRIFIHDMVLKPILTFEKLSTGLHYSLRLEVGNEVITLHDREAVMVLDKPGYIIVDKILMRVDQLNGNKLKPFIAKPFIFVPERTTKTYFKKFIVDLVSKVEVEAVGFEVIPFDEIKQVRTKVYNNFLTGDYELNLEFDYGIARYLFNETNKRLSFLQMDDDGVVTIQRVTRAAKEKEFIKQVVRLGLTLTKANCLKIPEADNGYALVDWLIKYKKEIQGLGIEVRSPTIDDKSIQLDKSHISLHADATNDWFDVKGEVVVGEFIIKFAALKDCIKNEDRFFKLPNGSFFIIPQSWLNKFHALFQFGDVQGDTVHIKKSHHTIIEQIEELSVTVQENLVNEIEYKASEHLRADLRPYQDEGVRWLIAHQINGLGACLADDMGLGKTMQTLAVLNYTKDNLKSATTQPKIVAGQLDLFSQPANDEEVPLRALIVLPASLVFNWAQEIKKFSPRFRLCVYVGADRKGKRRVLQNNDIVLTTYQTAQRDIDVLASCEWEYVILDESQMIKNKESKVFKAMNQLVTNNKISLSGTPIENSLADLWSQMQFINPDMLGTYSFFKRNFQIPIERHQDEAALEQLRHMVNPYILRRRKDEVAKDLPELTRVIEYVPMTEQQADSFEREKSAVRNYLLELDEGNPEYHIHVLSSLMRLRQLANHPLLIDAAYRGGSGKFDFVTNKLGTILKAGHKVLMFSSFTSHLDLFSDYFDKEHIPYCKLTGKTSQKQRKIQVEQFQNNSRFQIFLISIRAGGTGLNLTAADHVFILDPWWNPFTEEQAIARAHRIGSTRPISVFRFISKESIEEKIIRLQANKLLRSAELIESQKQIKLTKQELAALLN